MPATTTLLSLSDPRIAAMPTVECGEQLVSLVDLDCRLSVDDSAANIACLGYTPTFAVRETVGRRLVDAATNLPEGFRLLIKESLRPTSLQKFYFERRLKRTLAENSGMTEREAIDRTAQFVAPPWVAGHPSGGAIDITLSDRDGMELDLGCAYDEDESASNGACFSHFAGLSPDAQAHRATMFAVLESAGFVNYPFEWWHWSYGDRYWAVVKQQRHAVYGPLRMWNDCQPSSNVLGRAARARGVKMRRLIHHICFAMTAIAFAAFFNVASAQTAAENPAVIIRTALEQWRIDFNARRAAHICDLFAPDLRYDFQGLPEQTYTLLCKRLHRALADTAQSIHYGLAIKEIIVSDRLAVVRLTWISTEADKRGKHVTHDETGLDVFGLQPDGSWKIIRYIAYPAD